MLGILAGAFIAFGAIFATTVGAGSVIFTNAEAGPDRHAALRRDAAADGPVFSLGLVLVVIGGAELFTGNTLIVMAWASGKVRTSRLLFNWAIVVHRQLPWRDLHRRADVLFGSICIRRGRGRAERPRIAQGKVSLGFGQAFVLGLMCNTLVCLAVWMCYSARTTADRILTIVPPIAAFVAAGFEHSIANVYFRPGGAVHQGRRAGVLLDHRSARQQPISTA